MSKRSPKGSIIGSRGGRPPPDRRSGAGLCGGLTFVKKSAAATRFWSTWLNGNPPDEMKFRAEVTRLVDQFKKGPPATPPKPMALTDAASARADITAHVGFVPMFLDGVPDAQLPAAWGAMRATEFSPGKLDGKVKSLISVAVASQIPCRYCVIADTEFARLNGASAMRIIFLEMMPNLLPYLSASLVVAVAQAVLASVGLEALGLGTPSEPTLGMTIYWLMNESAFLLGLWWWILAPITVLVILFVGLYLLTVGIDELANPRLRVRNS